MHRTQTRSTVGITICFLFLNLESVQVWAFKLAHLGSRWSAPPRCTGQTPQVYRQRTSQLDMATETQSESLFQQYMAERSAKEKAKATGSKQASAEVAPTDAAGGSKSQSGSEVVGKQERQQEAPASPSPNKESSQEAPGLEGSEAPAVGVGSDTEENRDDLFSREKAEMTKERSLTKQVNTEAERIALRAQRVSSLSSELRQSMLRKGEFEDLITREIRSLREKLGEEQLAEQERKGELVDLLQQFQDAMVEKQELIERERDVLEQMQMVKSQVQEQIIRQQFDRLQAKSADVLSIEILLLRDMEGCRDQLAEELQSLEVRAARIDSALQKLPEGSDAAMSRSYNWQEVADLQEVLVDSIQSLAESDRKVASLKERFEEATRQKKEVLGETAALEADQVLTEPEDPASSQGGARRKSWEEVSTPLQNLSQRELLQLVADNSKTAVAATGKTVAVAATSFGDFLKSPTSQTLASSVVDLVESAKGHFLQLGKTFNIAREEFANNTLPGEEITTFDKLFQTTADGIKAVGMSPKVRTELDAAKEFGGNVPPTVANLGKLTGQVFRDATGNEELKSSVGQALDSVAQAFVALVNLGAKAVAPSSRQLPPPREAEEDRQR